MDTLTLTKPEAEKASLQQLARETVAQWSGLCQRFLDRQRHEIFGQVPTPEKLEEHRAAWKWMLRFARALYLMACDPDYPDPQMVNELQGRLLQLEHSWRMVHNPMPESEANPLLQQIFPIER